MKLAQATLILLALILTVARTDAQKTVDSNVMTPKEVSDYIKFTQNSETLRKLPSMPLTELKHIAQMAFHASESGPIEIQKESQNKQMRISPRVFSIRLNQTIRERISRLDFVLVGVQYLTKGTILKMDTLSEQMTGLPPDVKLSMPMINVTIVVNDVLKGSISISTGDTLTFFYFSAWRPTTSNFQVGESDLFPLEVMIENGIVRVYLDCGLDSNSIDNLPGPDNSRNSYGRYPIVNNELIDRGNTFEQGSSVNWQSFRSSVQSEIQTIKSW